MERTELYHFTVKMYEGKPVGGDALRVKHLREAISQLNKYHTQKLYVKLQGRGPRRGVRSYCQSLPLGYAKSADVYVYERR